MKLRQEVVCSDGESFDVVFNVIFGSSLTMGV